MHPTSLRDIPGELYHSNDEWMHGICKLDDIKLFIQSALVEYAKNGNKLSTLRNLLGM